MENTSEKFNSKDIRKKETKFTVRPKTLTAKLSEQSKAANQNLKSTSKNLKTSAQSTWAKFIISPPMHGKNKFITLGISILVITSAITVPTIIQELSRPRQPSLEELEAARREALQEVGDTLNSLIMTDPDDPIGNQEEVLSDLESTIESKINSSASAEEKAFLLRAHADVLVRQGRFDEALEILLPLIDYYRQARLYDSLIQLAAFISNVYVQKGTRPSAIEWLQKTIEFIDEAYAYSPTATDASRSFYVRQLEILQRAGGFNVRNL